MVVGGLSSSCLGSCGLPFWVETTVELIKGRQPGGGVEEWSGGRGFFGWLAVWLFCRLVFWIGFWLFGFSAGLLVGVLEIGIEVLG